MGDVTRILEAMQHGDPSAGEKLLPLVYAQLRQLARAKMSREKPGHTLQPTALVHEAWFRLGEQSFVNRGHFFAAAAEAMRRILIESARCRLAARRGGGTEHIDADEIEIAAPCPQDDEMLAIHESLDRLAMHDPRKAELVKLRYFAGFSVEEAAEILCISVPTVKRDWSYARAWLARDIART